MDNNPNTQAPVNTPPAAPQAQATQPVTNVVQDPPGGGGNKKLWIILGLVALIVVVGGTGVYWYITSQQKAPSTTEQPSPSPAAQTSVETLEKDLETSSLDDLDKEFSSVDTDLQGL